METIFCSIIIPVYNSGECLEKCIESVLKQTEHNFELILVDDGSTDNSGAICDHYSEIDSRVHVIHKENGGHTSARNVGLLAACGEYVSFVDSDDWIDKEMVADCFAASEYRPDVILFGYRRVLAECCEEKNHPYAAGLYDRKGVEEKLLPKLLTSGHFALWERMMRRELALKYQLEVDPRILVGEDLVCCVATLYASERVYVIPRAYYNYFQREDSVIHSYKNYNFENWSLVRRQLVDLVSKKLPDFNAQLGICSIRFFQRAILGAFERDGLGLKNARQIRMELRTPEFSEDIQNARVSIRQPARWFKHFCLKHRLVYMMYFGDRLQRRLRRR